MRLSGKFIRCLIQLILVIIMITGTFSSAEAAGNYTLPGSDYAISGAWAEPALCHVITRSDGTLSLVYAVPGQKLLLVDRRVSADGTQKSVKTVSLPGTRWGGCLYQAPDGYFYTASGVGSEDGKPCIYISRFRSDWTLQKQVKIDGEENNIETPFEAGNCDMAMTDHYLVVHASRIMMDGHQANVTFYLDRNTMAVIHDSDGKEAHSLTYVSHSFNQFVRTDGNRLYFLDHPDTYPRGAYFQSCPDSLRFQDWDDEAFTALPLIHVAGEDGWNYTGVTIGGFELGANGFLAAGTAIPFEKLKTEEAVEEYDKGNNVYLISISRNMKSHRLSWLTTYTDKTKIVNLRLIKRSADDFLIVYGVEPEKGQASTCYIRVNSAGTVLGRGSIGKPYFCTSEMAVRGSDLYWCHYVYSALGNFLVYHNWNISSGKLLTKNIPTGEYDKISKLEGSYYEENMEIGESKSLGVSIFSPIYKNDDDWDLHTCPGVWTSSDPSVLQVQDEETMNSSSWDDDAYSNMDVNIKAVGTGKASITCETGTRKVTFRITVEAEEEAYSPTATSIKSVKAKGRKALQIRWKKKTKDVDGYQLQIAQNKKFTKGKKTCTIKKKATVSRTIKGLKAKKKYYVRIRTFKKSASKTYHSKWSKVKSAKTR